MRWLKNFSGSFAVSLSLNSQICLIDLPKHGSTIYGTLSIYRTLDSFSTTRQLTLPENVAVESAGSVPALDRSLDLLEALSAEPRGLTLSELSETLSAPKNSMFRITQTLLSRGYLVRDEANLAFRLTPKLLKLSPPRWRGISLAEASREGMSWLRDETGETVQLGVLNEQEGVIIDQVEGTQPLRIVVNLGLRFALHNNAPGKLLLAYLAAEQQSLTLSALKLTATTPRTITTKSELRRECERIIAAGYSTDHAEADDGVHCIAAPIFDSDETVAGAIWISGPAKRLPKSRFRDFGLQVSAAGQRISRSIGELG